MAVATLGFSASSTPQIVPDELLHNGLDHRALGGFLSAVRQVVDLLKSGLERCLICRGLWLPGCSEELWIFSLHIHLALLHQVINFPLMQKAMVTVSGIVGFDLEIRLLR